MLTNWGLSASLFEVRIWRRMIFISWKMENKKVISYSDAKAKLLNEEQLYFKSAEKSLNWTVTDLQLKTYNLEKQ